MIISELIKHLEDIKDSHGDLLVTIDQYGVNTPIIMNNMDVDRTPNKFNTLGSLILGQYIQEPLNTKILERLI